MSFVILTWQLILSHSSNPNSYVKYTILELLWEFNPLLRYMSLHCHLPFLICYCIWSHMHRIDRQSAPLSSKPKAGSQTISVFQRDYQDLIYTGLDRSGKRGVLNSFPFLSSHFLHSFAITEKSMFFYFRNY